MLNVTINEREFQYIRQWMRNFIGQDLAEDKQYFVQVNLNDTLVKYELKSFAELITRLEKYTPSGFNLSLQHLLKTVEPAHSQFIQDVVDSLMVNETYFFRRPSTFADLRNIILPRLVAARQSMRKLRICCMACSTGQEVYSLLMTMDQHFPELLYDWDTLIVATDISQRSLQRAQAGVYTDWETTRGLSPELRDYYFSKKNDQWQISSKLISKVIFRSSNLFETADSLPFGPYDLILLRNVMIYFDMKAKRMILEKVRRVIASDGILMIGESETLIGLEQQFSISPEIPAACLPV
jgi:chemotaxis protein methyltransferase CheR